MDVCFLGSLAFVANYSLVKVSFIPWNLSRCTCAIKWRLLQPSSHPRISSSVHPASTTLGNLGRKSIDLSWQPIEKWSAQTPLSPPPILWSLHLITTSRSVNPSSLVAEVLISSLPSTACRNEAQSSVIQLQRASVGINRSPPATIPITAAPIITLNTLQQLCWSGIIIVMNSH